MAGAYLKGVYLGGHFRDTTSFCQKSISQMSFSQQVMVMSVGQNVGTNNVDNNWGMGTKLGEECEELAFNRDICMKLYSIL